MQSKQGAANARCSNFFFTNIQILQGPLKFNICNKLLLMRHFTYFYQARWKHKFHNSNTITMCRHGDQASIAFEKEFTYAI